MWLLAIAHILVFGVVYFVAFLLRFDFSISASRMALFWSSVGWVLGLKTLIFYVTGHFHGWWRYIAFSDFVALIRGTVCSLLALVVIDHFLLDFQIPRSCLILDALVTVVLLALLRSSRRFWDETLRPWITGSHGPPAFLVLGRSTCVMQDENRRAGGLLENPRVMNHDSHILRRVLFAIDEASGQRVEDDERRFLVACVDLAKEPLDVVWAL